MTVTVERFDSISNAQLDRLANDQSSLCVSIFIPTHRRGQEVQQDRIRLKNAVAEAKRQLVEFGAQESDVRSMLQPAADLAAEDAASDFWQHQSDGLALLLSRNDALMFQLPVSFDEHVSVSNKFALKPLIRAQSASQQFHVVAVSRNDVRVFRGDASGLTEESFEGLPAGLEEVVNGDQQRGHNRHSFKVRANSSDSSVPHGHVDNDEYADLKQYFRSIKDVIGEHLRAHNGPVIFAGVDELLPYFKEEFDCCDVIGEAACGNADQLSAANLHKKVWPLAERRINATTQKAVERFREAVGTDYGVSDLKSILPAASQGQIDTLLLKADVRNFGTCDDTGQIERSDEKASAETYDLFDIAAIRTLRADGKVFFVGSDAIETPVAAILRYVV